MLVLNEISTKEMKRIIAEIHGSAACFDKRIHIQEKFHNERVWEGEVLIFALLDHPTAKTCYAWEVDGRVTAVLHEAPVDSPEAAVRAAIAAEHRSQ